MFTGNVEEVGAVAEHGQRLDGPDGVDVVTVGAVR